MIKKLFLLLILSSVFVSAQRTAYTTFGYTTVYDTGAVVIEPDGNSPAGLHLKGKTGGWAIINMSNDANGSSSALGLFGTGNAFNYSTIALIDSTTDKSWNLGYRTGKTTAAEKRRLQLEYFDGSTYNVVAYFDTTYGLIFPAGYVDADSFQLNGTTALTKANWHSGIGASSMGALTAASLTSKGAISGTAATLGSGTNTTLLTFDIERDWAFVGSGSGSSTELQLKTLTSGKTFRIVNTSGISAFDFDVEYPNNLFRYRTGAGASATDSAFVLNSNSGSPTATFYGVDGDAWTIGINTSDAALFTGASGGYSFDGAITATGLSTFNGDNSGRATVGAGDSVQVSVTGFTTSGEVQVSYYGANSTFTKHAHWGYRRADGFTIYGDAGAIVSYWIHKK